jgi:hypothetical protein
MDDPQRAALRVVQDATAKAADMLKVTCQPDDVVTAPARLAALAKRLDTMLQAVKLVRPALENFYATLSDESPVRGDRTKTDSVIFNPWPSRWWQRP